MAGPLVHSASFEWTERELKKIGINLGGTDIVDWYRAMIPDIHKKYHCSWNPKRQEGEILFTTVQSVWGEDRSIGERVGIINHLLVDTFFHGVFLAIYGQKAEAIFEAAGELVVNKNSYKTRTIAEVNNYDWWEIETKNAVKVFWNRFGYLANRPTWQLPFITIKSDFRESIRYIVRSATEATVQYVKIKYEK